MACKHLSNSEAAIFFCILEEVRFWGSQELTRKESGNICFFFNQQGGGGTPTTTKHAVKFPAFGEIAGVSTSGGQ